MARSAFKKPKPAPQTAFEFLRAKYGKHCLAPCTGQDFRALSAWFHLVELWGTGDFDAERAALIACRAVLNGMQRSVWALAKAGIPGVLDYPHEDRLWLQVMALDMPDWKPRPRADVIGLAGPRIAE